MKKRTLIIGAGEAGKMVAREILDTSLLSNRYHLMGFLDDDPAKKSVFGISVLGPLSKANAIIRENSIDLAIIAIPSAPREVTTALLLDLSGLPVELKIVPGIFEIIEGDVQWRQLRPVEPEDLLGREEVGFDLEEIAPFYRDKSVLVTGAGGSIGSEIVKQILKLPVRKLIALGRGENSLHPLIIQYEKDARFSYCIADVQDRFKLDFVMRSEKPDVIFHAAAHKHVPIMEEFPEEAVKNNIFGTYNAAKAALENDVENFILVSTDKAVNPTSLMGATKKIAEKLILSLNGKGKTRFLCTRFGNVLGSRGSVIPTFLQQIRKGGPVTITHPDMERYFMSIPEAARLVIKSPSAREGHIFVLNMGNPVKITTLAENLIKLTGHSPGEIPIVYTGLRKGEKLYEELFGNEEPLVPTRFEKLMAATGKEELFSEETLQSLLEEFAEAAREVDRGRIRELVKKYLPRFQGSEKRVSG